MIIQGIFLLLLLALIYLAIFEEQAEQYKWYAYAFFGFSFFCISAFKPIGSDFDSYVYMQHYYNYNSAFAEVSVEYSFRIISAILHFFNADLHGIFIAFALLSIPLRLWNVGRMTTLLFPSLLIYYSNYFVLHDFTQIRAAVASAFVLSTVYHIGKGDRLMGWLCLFIAFSFHYSAVAITPVVFLTANPLNKSWKTLLYLSVPIAYAIYFLNYELLIDTDIEWVSNKLKVYEAFAEGGTFDGLNVFNLMLLARIAIFYFILYFSDAIGEHCKLLPLLLKVEAMSLVSMLVLSSLPVVAFRISELFGIVEIILFPLLIYVFRPQWIGRLIVVGYASILIINVLRNRLIHWDPVIIL